MSTSGSITYKELMQLHDNYQPTQKQLTLWKGKEETQSIWLELTPDLTSFLQEILDPNNEISGIRLYMGQYDTDTIPPEWPSADYDKKLTVGLVPTIQVGENVHNDITGEDPMQPALAVTAYNHGKICPPDICP